MAQELEVPQISLLLQEEQVAKVIKKKFYVRCANCLNTTNIKNLNDNDFKIISCDSEHIRLICDECGSIKFKFFRTI